MSWSEGEPIRVGVLGAGGLGKAAAGIISLKRELRLVAICDSRGVVASPEGVDGELVARVSGDLVEGYRALREGDSAVPDGGGVEPPGQAQGSPSVVLRLASSLDFARDCPERGRRPSRRTLAQDDPSTRLGRHPERGVPPPMAGDPSRGVATAIEAWHCDDPLGELLTSAAETLDALLVTLPNLPNEFIPSVVARIAKARESLVVVDVLKRTRAVEQMFVLDPLVKQAHSVVLTGCGATPGLLAAAAVLAAQSFIEVEKVEIWWGVGIANWDAYKATIREDIAHLQGYTVERAKAMTDAQIEALLEQTHGLLELRHMEHADDLLLQRVGVVDSREQVDVGGVMDTRHPKKPVSTTMTLTGITFEGKRSSHTFTLGDETTMAANVIGPALGYLKRGLWLKAHGLFGVFGSTEFLPMMVR